MFRKCALCHKNYLSLSRPGTCTCCSRCPCPSPHVVTNNVSIDFSFCGTTQRPTSAFCRRRGSLSLDDGGGACRDPSIASQLGDHVGHREVMETSIA